MRLCALATSLLVLLGSLSASAKDAVIVFEGRQFGPQMRMSGVYFTNFENSKFIECASKKDCANWASLEAENIYCRPAVCIYLDRRIRHLNRSPSRSGVFELEFVGRRAVHRQPKQHLYDTASKVLLERILFFRLSKG